MVKKRRKRVSCTKLSEVLKEFGIKKTKEQIRGNCEAYGRNVCYYLHTGVPETRELLEKFLDEKGIMHNKKYAPATGTLEINVSYFKAWHWDE